MTEDGRYLIVTLGNGTDPRNRLLYADLGDPLQPNLDAAIVAIVDEDVAELSVLGSEGPVLLVRTDLDAPNRRIVAIDLRSREGPPDGRRSCPNARNRSKARRSQEARCSATTWSTSVATCGSIRSPVSPRARSICPASRALRA